MRSFLLLPVMLLLAEISMGEELFVGGENRLEYWRWRETKEEFFEDKLDVEAIYGGFVAGLRYHLFQPSQVGDLREGEHLSRFFLEYQKGPFYVRGGTCYSIFGRGLLLAAFEDDELKLDRDLKGIKASVSLPGLDLTVLSGRPRNVFDYSTVNDTTDLIRGADLSFRPISILTIGTGYVRLNRANLAQPDTSRKTDLYGGRGELIWNWLNLYGEYGRKKGWDQILFQEGEGEGYYLSSSMSLPGFGLSIECCDYDSLAYGGLTYRYNNPPCSNRYGKAINNGLDEKGYQLTATLTPWGPVLTGASYANLETHDGSQAIEESYGEVKIESLERGKVAASVDRLKEEEHMIGPGPWPWRRVETTLLVEGTGQISWKHSISCSYRPRKVSEWLWPVEINFRERRVSVSYSYTPLFTLTLTAEDTNEELPPEEDTSWLSGTLELKLGESHDLSLMVGSQKGRELICSGGVCRFESPFEGWKLLVSSRF